MNYLETLFTYLKKKTVSRAMEIVFIISLVIAHIIAKDVFVFLLPLLVVLYIVLKTVVSHKKKTKDILSEVVKSSFSALGCIMIYIALLVLLVIVSLFSQPSHDRTQENIDSFSLYSGELNKFVDESSKNLEDGMRIYYDINEMPDSLSEIDNIKTYRSNNFFKEYKNIMGKIGVDFVVKSGSRIKFVIQDSGWMSLNYRAYIYSKTDIDHIGFYPTCCTYEYNHWDEKASEELHTKLEKPTHQYNYNLKVNLDNNRYYVEEFDG